MPKLTSNGCLTHNFRNGINKRLKSRKKDKEQNPNRNFPPDRMGIVTVLTRGALQWFTSMDNVENQHNGTGKTSESRKKRNPRFRLCLWVNLPLPMIPAGLFGGVYLQKSKQALSFSLNLLME